MQPKTEQQEIINKAINLLEPYDKEEVSYYGYYFLINGNDGNGDYDTCDNDDCMNKCLADLKAQYPKSEIREQFGEMNNDENFMHCCICGKTLDDRLNGMRSEFDYFNDKKMLTKEMLTTGDHAFCIRALLDAFPTYEYEESDYAKHQFSIGNPKPMQECLKRQRGWYIRVTNFSKKIINILE